MGTRHDNGHYNGQQRMMHLGIRAIGFGRTATVNLPLIKHAESLGFATAWTAEAYGNDAVSTAAWVLAQTASISVGTGIMQIPARTPALAAMTAMTLDQLSGGRFILGLGPSGPQVVEGWHGVPYGRPLTRTREYVAIVRQILARAGPLRFTGQEYQVPRTGADTTGLGKPLKSILRGATNIPIYTAAISEAGLRCAGEVADGVLLVWLDPDQADTVITPFVTAGRQRSRHHPGGAAFATLAAVTVTIDADLERARGPIKQQLALYVGGMGARAKNFYTDYARRLGFGEAANKIQDLFLAGRHGDAAAAVPDALVDALHLVGAADRIKDRLARWRAAARAGHLTGIIVTTDQPEALELLAAELL